MRQHLAGIGNILYAFASQCEQSKHPHLVKKQIPHFLPLAEELPYLKEQARLEDKTSNVLWSFSD